MVFGETKLKILQDVKVLRETIMTENNESDEVERPELPSGWRWGSGERAERYYSLNFGTVYRMGGPLAGKYGLGGFDGQVRWDKGGDHIVEIWPVESIDGNGDPQYGYSEATGVFDSEQEAVDAVVGLIEGL